MDSRSMRFNDTYKQLLLFERFTKLLEIRAVMTTKSEMIFLKYDNSKIQFYTTLRK
ncbi:hypothetical protein Belba_3313 [Belliella baltica DSM 15883]|uniref:Uncharacterized protein n=1 Tax=Belliella baltica (strain DSM 15883 / CIP 108006 / LMG 21964 / BA134) TaxID=866536 RepID=I3Z9A1_BELBD|nr:hypothetical protein Belba_3313 [Belliella baltica DSM 15883]